MFDFKINMINPAELGHLVIEHVSFTSLREGRVTLVLGTTVGSPYRPAKL